MFPVKFSKGKATINLNARIYDLYPVTEVCEKFERVCKIKVLYFKDEKKMQIEIKPKKSKSRTNLEELTLNFCNWVLHTQIKGA